MIKKECNAVKYKGVDYPCHTSLTMKMIGGKWKSMILYYLDGETLRYSELRKKLPSATEKTLSLQLKALEEDGIITRTEYNIKPPLKVEYALTDFGQSLIPVIRSIGDLGDTIATNIVE